MTKLSFAVIPEPGPAWVAQCLECDVAHQSAKLWDALAACLDEVALALSSGRRLSDLPRTPPEYLAMIRPGHAFPVIATCARVVNGVNTITTEVWLVDRPLQGEEAA